MRKSNSLIGTALRLLTEDPSNQEALKTSLGTLTRVLDAVNWHTISKDKPEAWLYFYEDFLEVYDNALRKRTGSYYTPPEVVSAMVNLVDEVLRSPLFAALAKLSLRDSNWIDCPTEWRAPFLPSDSGAWATFPALKDLFLYDGSGVMPGRTWIIAPDIESLKARWSRLIAEKNPDKKELLFHPHLRKGKPGDKHIRKKVSESLFGYEERLEKIIDDQKYVIEPIRYGFRSFDRQWIIPDARLINQSNPTLWKSYSGRQVHLTAPEDRTPTAGPALTLTGLIPDLHHYHGRGGRVFPLWCDREAKQSNLKPKLLAHFAQIFGKEIRAEDMMAYLAAIIAHPAFTSRFKADLVRPGLHVPLTADAKLFAEAVALGSEIIWVHCYGERFFDPKSNRPKQAPRLPKETAPYIPKEGEIPGSPEPLPDTMDYDPATRRLMIGKGYVENVTPEMWAYEVSGKQVLWHWFSYRRRDRSRPIIGDRRPPSPLDSIQPNHWLPEYTTDLLDLLNVLGRLIALEPAQADLLARICQGPLRSVEELRNAGALEVTNGKSVKADKKSESKT